MSDPDFELPVHFDTKRYASQQERQLRRAASQADGIACRRTWYGMKLVGSEVDLLGALVELAGVYKLGRLRPRPGSL